MSAPPFNPSESRGARGPGRGFRRGRRGPSSSGPGSHDEIIQGTDTDAAVSRLSAAELGYLDDPYAAYFVQGSGSQGPGGRRLPIINRGTYTRTAALDTIISAFLSTAGDAEVAPPSTRQIISLGAGTDTRPFRLFAGPGREGGQLIYHEVDFPTACARKLRTVQAFPVLRSILADATDTGDGNWAAQPSSGGEYYCHGVDLRNLAKDDAPQSLPGLRTDVPTLLVSECCLCYLEVPAARQVLKWFTDRIADTAVIVYEPVRPEDAFGRMMVSNLAARHIRMPTLEAYKEPADQVARLEEAGFKTAKVLTIHDIYERWVSVEEKARLDRLEGLDEVEEWILLASHYVVAWAWRGSGFWMCDERGNNTPAGS